MNDLKLIGHLANDNTFSSSNGLSVLRNTIAVERDYLSADGKKLTDFIDFVVFKAPADYLNNYAHKGDLILLNARVQMNSYTKQDGTKVKKLEVVGVDTKILNSSVKKQEVEVLDDEINIDNLPF